MAYRADIEIAVRGAQELKRLQNAILSASDAVDSLNSNLSGVANLVPRSFDNLNRTVAQAARSFNAAALGTKEATDAAREYVRATDAANAGLRERIALLAKVQAEQRRTVPGDAGVGQQTPALPPQLIRTYEIGKNWVKFFQDAAGVAVDLQARALNTKASWNDFFATAAQAAVNVKANSLNTQKNWNDFFATAAQAAVNVKANSLNTKASWNTFFAEAAQLAEDLTAGIRQTEGKASAAARERLAADLEKRRTAAPEVPRRLISGVAAPQGMAPGNAPVSTAMQGPLAGPGAMGFPVALSLSKVEQAGLETAAKKQAILQRMAATRQDLVGLAGNLQRLDLNSVVAIADAARGQAKLVELAKEKADLAAAALKTSQAETKAAVTLAQQKEKTLAAQRKERSGMVQNALIGGAFPMLFGGGAGATLGGFAGGFIQGNPMMSIVTSALGTVVDQFVAAAVAVGAALLDTATTFDFVKEKSLFSSRELEKYATKLQEAGFTATASAVAQAEILNKVGKAGAEGFTALASESDSLNRAFADLTVQMQAFIAGPLAALLNRLSGAVSLPAAANRATTLQAELGKQGQTAAAARLGAEVQKIEQSPNVQFGIDPQKAADEIKKLTDYYSQFVIKPKVKLSKEQVDKEVITVLEKQLQGINIAKGLKDQVTAIAREQENVDKQRADLVRSYEESLASLREKVEDRVSAIRLQTLARENQLLDVQSSIRLKSLEIANQQMVAAAGAGQRPELVAAAKEVAQIVANYTQNQLTAEEAGAKIKRDAALDVLKTDLEAAKFKINTEKEISRLNTETARKVADINKGVRDKNQEVNQNKFRIERQIAVLQLQIIQAEFALLGTQAEGAGPAAASIESYSRKAFDALGEMVKTTERLQPPGRIKEVAGVGGGGVSFAGVDKASAEYATATKNYVAAQLALNDLDPVKNTLEFAQKLTEFADKTDEMFVSLTRKDADEKAAQLRYSELLSKGLTDTIAQKVVELETTKQIVLSVYDIAIAQLESKKIAEATTAAEIATNTALIDQINLIKQRKDALEGKAGSFNQGGTTATGAIGAAVAEMPTLQQTIQKEADAAKLALEKLVEPADMISKAAAGIGDAFGASFKGIVDGSMTAQQGLATFFKSVADMFLDMAAQIIAAWIKMAILNTIVKIFGGAASSGASALPTDASGWANSFNTSLPGLSGDIGRTPIGFAEGGFVTGPTSAVIGEGGESEYVIPASKMQSAMSRYSRGARGEGVIAGSGGGTEGGGGAAAAGPMVVDVRYSVERINDVEYVTASQFQAGMRQAAQQGAAQGEQRTLRKLQMSSSTRRRVGV